MMTIPSLAILHHAPTDFQPLTSQQKLTILQDFWPDSFPSFELFNEAVEAEYALFFQYIDMEHKLLHHQLKLTRGILGTTACVTQILRTHRMKTRNEILEIVNGDFLNVDDVQLLQCIELAIRLWLTLNVRSLAISTGSLPAHHRVAEWNEDITLEGLVLSLFPKSRISQSGNGARIDPALTAMHLVKLCGIKINWSNNLAEHLSFDRRKRILVVYKHKICLINHSNSMEEPVIPREILFEAIDTLNLLFPFGDMSTNELLSKEKQPFWGLGTCRRARQLDLSKYVYWGDQLSELIRVFEEPPHDWWRLLVDRRNKKEYATLLVAILAFVLALFSLVFGGVSALYGVKQYNLGVAQACSSWDGGPLLAAYCA